MRLTRGWRSTSRAHAVPGKIQGVTQAVTFVAGDGQVMNIVFVESDAYDHKRQALHDIADRPGCDITLVSYDTWSPLRISRR